MKNAILLRSRMTRNRHVRFWSRVRRGDLLGLDNHKHQKKRDYLGVSNIGDDCLRKVQLQYEGKEAEFSASTLRTFDIGHRLEDLVAEWLSIAGFDLKTRNENGEQFGFSTADGRIRGHVDGIILNFPKELASAANESGQASRLLWECKTLNQKSWQETAKKGLMLTKSLYFAQIQLYMAYLELEQCLFTALNKDTSELYFELVPFDPEAAQRYSDRAVQIIKATENNEAMPCISSDPSFFKCKMCAFRNECRKGN